jgi:PAS domain S-box-containing protein
MDAGRLEAQIQKATFSGMMETSIFRRMPSKVSPWRRVWPYALVPISSFLALEVSLWLKPYLEFTPLLFLYFAAFASGRLGGVGPGVLATAVTAWMAEQYVLPGPWDFSRGLQDVTPVLGYVLVSSVTVAVVCTLRSRTAVLREKEAQLTDFLEHSTMGLQWLAEDGTIIWANGAAYELLGYASADYLGRKVHEFHENPGEAKDILRRLSGHERIKNYEARLRTREGAVRHVMVDATVFWQDGRFIHARCSLRDITARIQAEAALAHKRNLLRTLIDALQDCIYTKDRESRFLVSNLANVRVLGAATEAEVCDKTVMDLCPAEVARPFIEDDRIVISTGQPIFDREEHFHRENGDERTLLTTKLPLRDAAGEVVGLVGITRDISDRKRAEEALRKNEASLRLAQRIGRIGSWEADLIKDTLEWSDETYRLFGYRRETFVPTGEGFFQRVHPEDREMVRRTSSHALRHGKHYSVDYRIIGADGQQRFMVQQARILRDAAGGPIRMIGTVQDITDRKLADEALRNSESRYRQLIQALPGAVYTCDATGSITLYNQAAVGLWGRTPEIGKDMWCGSAKVLTRDGDPMPLEQCPMAVCLREGRSVRGVEIVIERPDGTRSLVLPHPDPIHDAEGNVVGAVNMLVDLSERQKSEEAVRRLNEELEARVEERTRQLEQANRELEAFSYSVSHDLRAPVRAINGFAQIIHEDFGHQFEPEVSRLFRVISSSALRMGELIDDLLAFSRLGAYEPKRVLVDTDALVRSIVAELNQHEAASRASIRLGELPPVEGDESMLRQVFTNLIANAVKFSRGQPVPSVTVGAREEPDRLVYFVRDNGVGFDVKYASKLFKVFQRLHKPEEFEGTGVGLAIVHRVVQRHGGEVWADSAPGLGATFSFSLPVTSRMRNATPAGLPSGSEVAHLQA